LLRLIPCLLCGLRLSFLFKLLRGLTQGGRVLLFLLGFLFPRILCRIRRTFSCLFHCLFDLFARFLRQPFSLAFLNHFPQTLIFQIFLDQLFHLRPNTILKRRKPGACTLQHLIFVWMV
jgi:hypothetical protein